MEIANLVLEYFRVLLTFPVLTSVVAVIFIFTFTEDIKALLLRVATIKLPGGTEVSMPQSNVPDSEQELESTSETGQRFIEEIIDGLNQEKQKEIGQLVSMYIGHAELWEFRYLNYFLVPQTQRVLDWFVRYTNSAYVSYDAIWLPYIPSANDRQQIFNVLQAHRLVSYDASSGMITITDKGRRYQQWRGELPPTADTSTGTS